MGQASGHPMKFTIQVVVQADEVGFHMRWPTLEYFAK